ncbi:COG4280 domain-containing protein [Leifsonia sp. NPDC058248]|uniref:COG4280 domain-containing protein n=1 Tax=Leifsonia sp. NPDC058248 TaxID=3346402 RepID=UPI0036DEE638
MNDAALFFAVFLACLVEAVEATTIVLAAGSTRHWRSAVFGVLAGVAVLVVAVAIAGPAIALLPLGILRLVVGGVLLVFGLQWIRKAVLRASGYKALHDEELIFQKQVAAARRAESTRRGAVKDWYAFTLSFKGVVLEGLEVVFIVLTFGANQQNLPLATIAAAAAVVVVVVLGVVVRGPLSRVPENTLKFIVGVMLTGFGVFWGAEGAGAVWPGADLALLVIVPAIAIVSLALAWGMRSYRLSKASERGTTAPQSPQTVLVPATGGDHAAATEATASTVSAAASGTPTAASGAAPDAPAAVAPKRSVRSRLASFGAFWYDFIVGDDWQIAAGVALSFVVTYAVSFSPLAWVVVPLFVLALIPYGVKRALR